MFSRLTPILEEYLQKAGALDAIAMGSSRSKKEEIVVDQAQLAEQLQKESSFNNRLVTSVTVLYFLLFGLASGLVIYHRASPRIISSILGGSVLSLIAVIKGLSQLWREKNAIDMLRIILPSLSPDQSVKVIMSLYFASKKRSTRKRQKALAD